MPLQQQACVPPVERCIREWRTLAGAAASASVDALKDGANTAALVAQSEAGAPLAESANAVPATVRAIRDDPLGSGVVLPWQVLPGGGTKVNATRLSDGLVVPAAHHEWKAVLGIRTYVLNPAFACAKSEFLVTTAAVRFEEPAVGLDIAPNGTAEGEGAPGYVEQSGHNASLPLAPLMDLEIIAKDRSFQLSGFTLTAADPPTHGFRRAITGFRMGHGEQLKQSQNGTEASIMQANTVIELATTPHSAREHPGNPEPGPASFGVSWVRRGRPRAGQSSTASDGASPSDGGVSVSGISSPLDSIDGGHHAAWLAFSLQASGARLSHQFRGDEEPSCDPQELPIDHATVIGVATAGPTRLEAREQ